MFVKQFCRLALCRARCPGPETRESMQHGLIRRVRTEAPPAPPRILAAKHPPLLSGKVEIVNPKAEELRQVLPLTENRDIDGQQIVLKSHHEPCLPLVEPDPISDRQVEVKRGLIRNDAKGIRNSRSKDRSRWYLVVY